MEVSGKTATNRTIKYITRTQHSFLNIFPLSNFDLRYKKWFSRLNNEIYVYFLKNNYKQYLT